MPGLHIDKVGGGNNSSSSPLTETSFFELQTLVNENKLIPGSEYLLTDYLHKYFIEGSDSAGIKDYYNMRYSQYGYGILDGYQPELLAGTEVTITKLPEDYAGDIQVGDTTTITIQSSDYYFKFANGLHFVGGSKFSVAKARYTNIPKDAKINDINGRPVIKPGGLVNTEVHDGLAYMEMTAEENHAVPPEKLILTADSANSFEARARSFTYEGDVVDYSFGDNNIYNDNSELIATRNGFIYGRINEDLRIELNIDWRVQRFRRWCIDLDSRTKFLNQNLDPNTTRIGYQGKYLFTSASITKENLNHFYIGKLPEGTLMCLDKNAMKTEFQFEAEGVAFAKDYPVFPLDASLNPTDSVKRCQIRFLNNTVFQLIPVEFLGVLDIQSDIITGSTFVSDAVSSAEESRIRNVIALDYFDLIGRSMIIEDCNVLSRTETKESTNSTFKFCVFGTMQDGVRIDGYEMPVAWWLYVHSKYSYVYGSVFSGVLPYLRIEHSRVINSSFFFYYSFNNPAVINDGIYLREIVKLSSSIFSNVGLRITGTCDRVLLSNLLFPDHNPNRVNGLFLYDIHQSVSYKEIKKNETTDALYFESLDADYKRTFTELSSQTANPIDLAVGIVVDDAAPVVGNNVVFSITASNNLGAAATNVIVNSLLPAGYTYVSDDGGANYNDVTGIWNVGNLAISENHILNITATVESAGVYQVDVDISSDQAEIAIGDNTATITPVPTAV